MNTKTSFTFKESVDEIDLSVLHAKLVTSVYQAKSVLRMAELRDVYRLNLYSLEQAFETFNEDAFQVTRSVRERSDGQQCSHLVEIKMGYPLVLDGPIILNSLVAYPVVVETEVAQRREQDGHKKDELEGVLEALRLELRNQRLHRL